MVKRTLYTLLFLGLMIIVSTPCSAQENVNNIHISPTVKTAGKIVYLIKRGETLYGIAKRYDVSLNDILNANPGVRSFKVGTKINIPVLQQVVSQPVAAPKPAKTTVTNTKPSEDKTAESKLAANNSSFNDLPEKNSSGPFNVALLVPFYLEDVDSIKMNQKEPRSFSFLQFYEASLLAIDSLRKQGLDVKLFVYDSDGDEGIDKTRAIFQKKELADMDLIIGPFYAKCFEIASKYAGLHRIPIVNPLSKRNEILAAKPWVFKVQPGQADQMGDVAAFISKHFPDANVVIVRSDKTKMAEEATTFKAAMLPLLKKENKSALLRESFFKSEGVPGIKFKLSTDKPNILVVLSTDEVFVSGLFRDLNEISNDYDLTLMGIDAWEHYKLDFNWMVHLKMTLYGNKYVDFSDLPVQKFSSAFLKSYNTLPQVKAYAFDGFDITYFFLSSLMKYGRQFGQQVGEYEYQGLQDSFHFHKIEGGGYENAAVNFYKMENNYLKRIR